MTILLQGLLAGLALALPLGAISVLLLHEAFTRGWWPAAAGATGVALVDLGYAVLALAAGAVLTGALAGHERAVHLLGAALLIAVALRGLAGLRSARATQTGPREPSAVGAGTPSGALATATRFVVLTMVNPLTAVYFTVLATGLAVRGPRAGALFAAGVFLGSWAWQLTLAAIGAVLGERLPDGARRAISVLGYAIVLGYAVRLAAS